MIFVPLNIDKLVRHYNLGEKIKSLNPNALLNSKEEKKNL